MKSSTDSPKSPDRFFWGAENDYPYGVVRLATYFNREKTDATLIFASVELLPQPFPEPDTGQLEHVTARGVAGGTLFFRRVAMTGTEALRWYVSVLEGAATTPIPLLSTDRVKADGGPLSVGPLTEDPPWPELGLFLGTERPEDGMRYELPFLSDWQDQPRIHRSLAATNVALANIVNEARNRSWLAARVHLDFVTHPEWIGSLALIAPNPVWRRLERRRIPPSDGHAERTLVNIVPRPGASTDGLEVVSFQESAGLVTRLQRRRLRGERAFEVFYHGNRLRAEGLIISCEQRGPLYWSKPAPFIRSITLRSSVIHGGRRYTAPAGRTIGGPTEIFGVPDIADETITVGDRSAARDEFADSASRRARKHAGERLGQRWFAGDHGVAAAFLRSIIGEARSTLGIFDPYVTGLELFRFAHAVTRAAVSIRILTSALPFHQTDHVVEAQRLDEVEQEVTRLQTSRNSLAGAQVRVLRGDPPRLHDRFLVIDDDVWFTGNSLGTIGDRAGMIIRLPDPAPVLEELAQLFDGAEDIATFVSRRRDAVARAAATLAKEN
ncbi:VPA1262 family N-terminal domain-containing protein [Rhizobium rhizoryzae]|uniref:VPA1262 family N-terminal domain-containing protein n=2 Tax=Rhizobium rhizoryzae TaxID=451876 RepID=UPI00248476FF|nr:VPA1262 family N-terminal domain-containing protein [Rhizobium rhizoryzae]